MESKLFAFVFPMASGHINPSLPLARSLVSGGHQVHYLAREQMRAAIEDTGATFWSEMEEESELYEGREGELCGAMSSLKKEYGMESDPMLVSWNTLSARSLELQLPGCIRWLRKINPSAVVYCPLLNQDAGYAAHVLRIPSVALLTTAGPGSMAQFVTFFLGGQDVKEVIELVSASELAQESVQRLKETYGFDYDCCSSLRAPGFIQVSTKADLVLMTTTEELQDPSSPELLEAYRKAGVTFVGVGPLLDQKGARRAAGHKFEEASGHSACNSEVHKKDILKEVQEAKAAGRPVIFASMGTVVTGDSKEFGWQSKPPGPNGPEGLTGKELCQAAFRGVFDAFGEANDSNPITSKTPLVILATGPQPDALENLEVPCNAICVPEVPQVDLLRSGVDLFLTHFGQNSFMESLTLGIPMVGCPAFGDQVGNAQKAEAMGVALRVERPVPKEGEERQAMVDYSKQVADALHRVFQEPHFRQNVQEMSRRIQEAGGIARATEILLEVARKAESNLWGLKLSMEVEKPSVTVAC